jgi:hypothetical protein
MERHAMITLGVAIRQEMADLVGSDAAPLIGARVDDLLERLRAGQPVDDELFEVLTDDAAIRRRVLELLPATVDTTKDSSLGLNPLPGYGEAVAATIFACPYGDYRYPEIEVGEPIPLCPAHHVKLLVE